MINQHAPCSNIHKLVQPIPACSHAVHVIANVAVLYVAISHTVHLCWLQLKGFNYSFVAIDEVKLQSVLKKDKLTGEESIQEKTGEESVPKKRKTGEESVLEKLPVRIYWDVADKFSLKLERYDHLYTVHYPDPERKGEHRRCFGGDAIFGTQGTYVYVLQTQLTSRSSCILH